MSQKIWVIEDGDYSDYKVVGVYSTRENAETALAAMAVTRTYNPPTIEEWKMDPGIEEMYAGLSRISVSMKRDGSTIEVQHVTAIEESFEDFPGGPYEPGRYAKDYVPGEKRIRYTVWARDEQHAVKIANEYRAQAIAAGEMSTEIRYFPIS